MSEPPTPRDALETFGGGRYAPLGLLGRGGMGEVYRVRDAQTGEQLALKRVRHKPGHHQAVAVAQLEREYHTLAQLSHPSVIRVREYGVDAHGAYYTMELLDGVDLHALGRQGWRDTCHILRELAAALALLHQRRLLHRDLSPKNVVRTRAGAIKLIDFGAMTPIGVARALVGTPPLVPPEAVQQQALDARADLYALGALGYFLLTGRHAFPARSFDQLRDLWRSVPIAPERIVAEIPTALSQLVLELLALDRYARPHSAAEVIERLDGVLGQHAAEDAEVGRAYLTTPRLVGRDASLRMVRDRMLQGLRGRGSVVLLEGDVGCGRSRMLDACVLEAKLLGATVLRADASDAGHGDYGVVAALGDQLVRALPELATDVARLRRGQLGHLVPSLADADAEVEAGAGKEASPVHERRHLQTAVRDWFRAVARGKRIVLAVDDLERADEPSLALLASLAHKSERRKLLLVASIDRSATPTDALQLLREAASIVELGPLTAADTESLFESIFGHATNVASIAGHVHELAAGNPRQVMELAEHMVHSQLARYAAGSWTLPGRLSSEDLPLSIEAGLRARLERLDAPALALAEAMSVAGTPLVALIDCIALCADAERASAFASLDALLDAGVLLVEGDGYRFARVQWRKLLYARIDPARRRALHARMAEQLGASADPLRLAHHWMEGGKHAEAIAWLLAKRGELSAWQSALSLELLSGALEAADALHMPLAARIGLQTWLIETSALLGRLDLFERLAPPALALLIEASGVGAFERITDEPDSSARVRRALAAAQARNAGLAADAQLAPALALRELARVCNASSSMAASALEPALIDRLPSLQAFEALFPAVEIVGLVREATRHHLAGRYMAALSSYREMLPLIDEGAGLTPSARVPVRRNLLYGVGILEGMHGRGGALDCARELEDQPGFRVNAWRIRSVYQATLGDFEEARRSDRRAQLLQLQDGVLTFPATDHQAEAHARWLCDDVDGIKQMLERFEVASRAFPARGVFRRVLECQYERVKGDPARALELLRPVLEATSPEHSVRFCWVGATHVMLLVALRQSAAAVAHGERYLEAQRARGLTLFDCAALVYPLADALAQVGRVGEAIELSEALIAAGVASGVHGLPLSACYEARARVAMHARDRAGFDHFFAAAAQASGGAESSAVAAKLARLARQAERAFGTLLGSSAPPLAFGPPIPEPGSAEGTVISRMAECVDGAERAHCALTVLLEHGAVSEGYLFGRIDGRFTLLASVAPSPRSPEFFARLELFLVDELEAVETTAPGGESRSSKATSTDPEVARHRILPLYGRRDGEPVIAAVAALYSAQQPPQVPSATFLAALADSLLEHDDVDAMTRLV